MLPPCLGHGRTCCGSASRRQLAILAAASTGDTTPALGRGDVSADRSGGHRCGLGEARRQQRGGARRGWVRVGAWRCRGQGRGAKGNEVWMRLWRFVVDVVLGDRARLDAVAAPPVVPADSLWRGRREAEHELVAACGEDVVDVVALREVVDVMAEQLAAVVLVAQHGGGARVRWRCGQLDVATRTQRRAPGSRLAAAARRGQRRAPGDPSSRAKATGHHGGHCAWRGCGGRRGGL